MTLALPRLALTRLAKFRLLSGRSVCASLVLALACPTVMDIGAYAQVPSAASSPPAAKPDVKAGEGKSGEAADQASPETPSEKAGEQGRGPKPGNEIEVPIAPDDKTAPENSPGSDQTNGFVRPSGLSGPVSGEDAGKVQRPGVKDAGPAGGITLMERMGIPLPDLPPEKPYTGKVDLAYGAFQRGLFATAFDYALPLAEKGDPAAQTLIAELMTRGLAVKRDMKGAAFWYAKAAAGGDPAALFKYALMLIEGRFVSPDRKLADDYMRRAAEAGNASAQFNWAQLLVSENPGKKGLLLALPFYEQSAEQGIADAQYAVAQIYRNLPDVPAEKRQLAREWLVRAARAGFDTAELDIGIWLINGIAGPQDLEQGFKWLRIAANRGNVAAQNRLAHVYVAALGTRPDPVEAAKWYVLSRRAGLADPALEDFYLGLPDSQQKQAIEAANKYRTGQHRLGRPVSKAQGSATGKNGARDEVSDIISKAAKPVTPPPIDPTGLPGVSLPPVGGKLQNDVPKNDADKDENPDDGTDVPDQPPTAP